MEGEFEKKASEAFLDDNFELACDLYSQALSLDRENANLFANRAQTHIKLKQFTEAVADTNKAIELDPSMPKAYLRKGIACIQLEEYETAKVALRKGSALDPSNPKFKELIEQCERGIAEEMNDILKPPVSSDPLSSAHSASFPLTADPAKENESVPGKEHSNQATTSTKPKYRHEFYQKPNEVVLTIFAKGVPARSVLVEFGEQMLSVTIDIPGEDVFFFQPRLFGKIVPEKCRYEVLSTKIEVRLFKADTINWISLEYRREYKKQVSTQQRLNSPTDLKTLRPAYPSSKSKGIDWDKLEAEVKSEEQDEKLDGDAALNKLFRDIYQNADEDARRAMSKSFVESNGTVLSTNWKDVGSKRVEGSPPDGMEMRKWEY